MIKGYRSAFDQVFSRMGKDVADDKIISRMFISFEKSSPPKEIRPPDCNVAMVLKTLRICLLAF